MRGHRETVIKEMPPAPGWFQARGRRHLGEFARLALPTMISRIGILMLLTMDIAMLGRIDAAEVAGYTLGISPINVLMVIGIGLLFGTMVLTSHLRGAGRMTEAGAVWRRALPHAAILGCAIVGLSLLAEHYFRLAGQSEELAQAGAQVSFIYALGMFPMMLFIATSFFLEGLGRPLPSMITIWICNGINVLLNLVLIQGWLGGPELGAVGAAAATAISRGVLGFGLVLYVWWLRDRKLLGVRTRPQPGWIAGGREFRRYGYAAGLSYGFESFSFAVTTIFAGWLGAEALAVFAVGFNLTAMLFMVALGFASASAIRVGVAHGRMDYPDRGLAGWIGLSVVFLIMGLAAVCFIIWPEQLAGLYLTEARLVTAARPIMIMLGFIIIVDGLQITLASILRATGDAWVPTASSLISFIIVQIAAAYWFAIHLDHGVIGIFEGITSGLLLSCLLLGGRWVYLCFRDRQPAQQH